MAWAKSTKCDSTACVEVDMDWIRSSRSEKGNCVEVGMEFKKSTRSNPSGNCVEVGADWTKSSYSGNSGSCVEYTTQTDNDTIAMRDSKDPEGGILEFSAGSWNNFVAAVKAGDFDLPA